MKKIVLVSLAFLFVLVGCGQKKETGTATKTEKDTLQSALPVIENAEKRDARLAAQKQEVTTGKKSIHSRLGEKKQKTSERKSDGKSVNKEQVTL